MRAVQAQALALAGDVTVHSNQTFAFQNSNRERNFTVTPQSPLSTCQCCWSNFDSFQVGFFLGFLFQGGRAFTVCARTSEIFGSTSNLFFPRALRDPLSKSESAMRFESHFKSSFGNVKAFNLKKIKIIADSEPVPAMAAGGPAAGGRRKASFLGRA